MKEVNACIITIGDELLIGQTIDTNSAFIAQELNKIGIWVKRRVAIGDSKEEILNTLSNASKESQVIIITGGLGPTADDITKPTLCDYFHSKIIIDEGALQNVKDIFSKLNRPLTDRNLKQAEVPDNCTVLPNLRGTAPGMWFEAPPPPTGGLAGTQHLPLQGPATNSISPESEASQPGHSPLGGAGGPGFEYMTADPITYGLLKQFVKEHRRNPTQSEEALWHELRGKQLEKYKFRRQHIIGNYIADFVCLPEKLIIEVDGLIHQLPQNKENDERRTEWLQMSGFRVLRFSNDDVINHMDKVLSKILQALKEESQKSNTSASLVSGMADAPKEVKTTIYVSLPGVPNEMKGLMQHSVIPKLKESLELPAVVHSTLLTSGIGESTIADVLEDFERNLPGHIKLAYLPSYGMVRLRLTGRGSHKETVDQEVSAEFEKMKPLVAEWMVADSDITLQQAVSNLIKQFGKTVATAESCTGGYIAHLITSKAGSSAIFNGSVVSYSNKVKENVLGVKEETIRNFGAVSEQTVKEMVQGVLNCIDSDYALATSGIMGPDGGSVEKPVGMVWIAVGNKNNVKTAQYNFRYDRTRNIEMTAQAALTMLRRFILEQETLKD
jgi:PncC family amidohydrolase